VGKSWAALYRPTTIDALVGQPLASRLFRGMFQRGSVPSSLLLTGNSGTGKTTFARLFAAEVIGGEAEQRAAVLAGTHPALSEVDAASHGLVDDMRRLRSQAQYSAGGGRVLILDEAHAMSRAAGDVLLKIMEDPPPDTYFVLATTRAGRLSETLASRCVEVPFSSVSTLELAEFLSSLVNDHALAVPADVLPYVALSAQGSVRRAVAALEQVAAAGVESVSEYTELFSDPLFAVRAVRLLVGGQALDAVDVVAPVASLRGLDFVSDQLASVLVDVGRVHSGAEATLDPSKAAVAGELAARIPVSVLVSCLGMLWDFRAKVDSAASSETLLSVLIVLLGSKLTEGTPV